ncbi:MAG: hypothetical protein JW841_00095 [Deltaproteobacteria bacterium]|nr:hypothetical protein [Deltaproteobacteria bacterium]
MMHKAFCYFLIAVTIYACSHQSNNCTPGTIACECLPSGECIIENGPKLICVDNLCLATENEANVNESNCVDGNCNVDVIAINTCVPGEQYCNCREDDACNTNELVCVAGQCVAVEAAPPKDPKCYTPCESDLILADGTKRDCPVDKLMPGCIGARICDNGTCVLTDGESNRCYNDIDCPEFQTCKADGKCYSDCNGTSDCAANKICYKHVCHEKCNAEKEENCKTGESCNIIDGENGYCKQIAEPNESIELSSVSQAYSISANYLTFTNIKNSKTFIISNQSDDYEVFTVQKSLEISYAIDSKKTVIEQQEKDKECNANEQCPLAWLKIGLYGNTQQVQSFDIGIEPGGEVIIEVANADAAEKTRWQGNIKINNPKMGFKTISLDYSQLPDGRWVGEAYYFAQFGTYKLNEWRVSQASRDDDKISTKVGNALIQQWAAFRRGSISYRQLLAALTSLRTESWRWPNTVNDCPESPNGACYPFDISKLGLVSFTNDQRAIPIPSGITELPIAFNLRQVDKQLKGRIESNDALQYPGNPAITFDFNNEPNLCERSIAGTCLNFINNLQATVVLGGRYETKANDTNCQQRYGLGYELQQIPWLVDGFARGISVDQNSNFPYRYECRNNQIPWQAEEDEQLLARNGAMSGANPIPDGRTRRRYIRLVDGALIEQTRLIVIFEEVFESFLPGNSEPFSAFGYFILERQSEDLPVEDKDGDGVADVFNGVEIAETQAEPSSLLQLTCDASLIEQALGYGAKLNNANAANLAQALIDGVVPGSEPEIIDANSNEAVHYLCADTGLFDGGAGATSEFYTQPINNDDSCGLDNIDKNFYKNNNSCDDGGIDSQTSICPLGTDKSDCPERQATDRDMRVPCPAGSNVIYFTVDPTSKSQAEIASLPCQKNASCEETLNDWKKGGGPLIQLDPVFRCFDESAYCSDNRYDLRAGKQFYSAMSYEAVMPPLYNEIDLAFRYKTRFRSRSGDNVGFAPEICIPDSNQIPYCYEPPRIEAIRQRVDCLLHIWSNYYDDLNAEAKNKLDNYLCSNAAYTEACISMPTSKNVHDGFERLFAELLVMMGDEAFTQAYASRFDLAGTHAASFAGSKFEPDGINLSGQAGHEIAKLYEAVQYYQEALNRFYYISPLIWSSLDYNLASRNFVTPETVTWFLDRINRASTQKARALGRIAKAYQAFNRPDLARFVVERSYVATYIESVVIARLMLAITDTLRPEDIAQVIEVLEQGQRRYRMALLDLRNVYGEISDNVSYFGLPPDYIPFPTLSQYDVNAFRVILNRAKVKVVTAAGREDEALASSRAFDTDAAEFQAELLRLRNTFENQLGDVCGTFTDSDGRVYPAISSYAYLDQKAKILGDPCGFMGNGAIANVLGQLDITRIELQRIILAYENELAKIEIERSRVSAQCGLILTTADYVYQQGINKFVLQQVIEGAQWNISRIERTMKHTADIAEISKCDGISCPAAIAGTTTAIAAKLGGEAAIITSQIAIKISEVAISKNELDTARWQTESQCDSAVIESNARIAEMLLRLKEIELEALKGEYQLAITFGEIERQRNLAKRLEQEYAEAQDYSLNIMAARNDPNIRIYRNDAYLNADITFTDALQEAYRATRVYEYYTSQSYADLDKLFLIRMVQKGDYNLSNYLIDLENAFNEFEEYYGQPDTRIALISLRDDILRIPHLAIDGSALSQAERIAMLREQLRNPQLLDANGYLAIPFSTTTANLSPLTRNHKILYIEAEVIGSDIGDTVGRIYVKQQGTSVVTGLIGDTNYYRFPTRMVVLNPFFNGTRIFNQDVYKSARMRDRPLLNTAWELIINQKDEVVNQDINLEALTDIRLYVYYTDFTIL